MSTDEWLQWATVQLETTGIGTARLDCLVLLEEATGKNRAHLLAHPETALQEQSVKKLTMQVERRAKHEPLAYIRKKIEFYGREFYVDQHVLIPRPESETMIALLRDLVKSKKLKVKSLIDVGTGSGALAITAKLELPAIDVSATDIDTECLVVARHNAQKQGVDIDFFQGDLLQPLSANSYQLTALLCNLPYVPDRYQVNHEVLTEPRQAVFGGADGLDIYRHLLQQATKLRPKYILTESLPFQHAQLAEIATAAGYELIKTDDFIQAFMLVNSAQ